MSWKKVLVVRPQPGQAVTCGVKLRSSSDCRICWQTMTSSVRSPLGSGVSEARMVSPMPSCKQHGERGGGGDDALRSEAGFGQAQVQRIIALRGQLAIDRDQILDAADLGAQDDLVAAKPVALGGLRRKRSRWRRWRSS